MSADKRIMNTKKGDFHFPTNRRQPALLILALLVGLFHGEITADVIYLKNGNDIQGEIIKEGPRELIVRFPSGIMQIRKNDILRIESESKFDYLVSEADKHLRRSDYDGAIELYDKALDNHEDSRRAHEGLARAYKSKARALHTRGRLEDARSCYLSLLELQPGHRSADREISVLEGEIARADTFEKKYKNLVQQGNVAGYAGLLDLYERYPSRRARLGPSLGEASVLLGHEAFRASEWARAEQHYVKAISYDPNLLARMATFYAHARIQLYSDLAREGLFEDLLARMDESLAILPTNKGLIYFRGLALHGIGRVEEAADAYLEVSGSPRPSEPGKQILKLRKLAETALRGEPPPSESADPDVQRILPGNWRKIETDHFVVHHRNEKVGRQVAKVAEKVYKRLYKALDCDSDWYKKCEIYLYPDKEEFTKVTGQHKWTGGSHTIVRRGGVLLNHRIESFQTQPRLVSAIIPHEVTHALLAHRLAYRKNVPLWLNEGLAIRSEPPLVQRHYHRVVAQAYHTRQIFSLGDFTSLVEYPEDRIEIFYAQSFSLTNFLASLKGQARFMKFLEDMCVTRPPLEVLLKRHYKIRNLATLEKMWRAQISH